MIKLLDEFRREVAAALFMLVLVFVLTQAYTTWQHVKHEEAERSRDRFWRSAMTDSDAAVIVVDGDTGAIVEWSAGAEQLTGWLSREVLGYGLGFILPNESYLRHHRKMFQDPEVRKKSLQRVFRVYSVIITRAGQQRHVMVTIRGHKNGRHLYIACVDPVDRVVEVPPSAPDVEKRSRNPEDFGPRQALPDDYWSGGHLPSAK